jgi:PucR family transcriptional regulator, purine catabolism regulatory protein
MSTGRPDISPPAATSLVERLRAVHLQMVDAVLTGDGLAAVADLAADAAGGPVAVVVPRLGVAVVSAGGEGALGAVRRYIVEQRSVPPEVVAEVPIASGDERIGGVVLLDPGRPDPEAVEFLHLAAVAALTEVAVEEAREEVEENVRCASGPTGSTRPMSCAAPGGSAAICRAVPRCYAPSSPPSARATWSR